MSDLHSSDAEFDSPLPPPWSTTCAPSPNVRQARRGHRCSPKGGGLDRDISLEDLAVGRYVVARGRRALLHDHRCGARQHQPLIVNSRPT